MFLDRKLSDAVLEELVELTDDDRKKLHKWFEKWISEAAILKPGPWVDQFRPRLESLIDGLSFKVGELGPVVQCKPLDNATLALVTRGSGWFNGIDQLNLKLWSVIITR